MITAETKTFGIVAGTVCVVALTTLSGALYLVYKKDVAYEDQLTVRATRIAIEKEVASVNMLMTDTVDEREMLPRYILTEDSVVDFLSLIGDLAHARGLTIQTRSLAVEEIEGTDVFEQLTLEVEVTGSFESVTQMLSLLESLPYQMQVNRVTIERADESEARDLWRGSERIAVTKYK